MTFFTEDDAPGLRPIANAIRAAGGEVPEWMTAVRRDKRAAKRRHLSDRVGAAADMEVAGGGRGGRGGGRGGRGGSGGRAARGRGAGRKAS